MSSDALLHIANVEIGAKTTCGLKLHVKKRQHGNQCADKVRVKGFRNYNTIKNEASVLKRIKVE